MTTVIYHSADFDGIFCREIALKFLGDKDVNYIGWNFGDPPLQIPTGPIYVMDLPLDAPFGFDYHTAGKERGPQHPAGLVWIDHHASSIASHPTDIPGYRIDGVAACRLAWAWFQSCKQAGRDTAYDLPTKEQFVNRQVQEPLAVRLAGEYDVWDKRDPNADLFQYGLRSQMVGLDGQISPRIWGELLHPRLVSAAMDICQTGRSSRTYAQIVDANNMQASFLTKWEGLTFLCLNGRGNSLTFASLDVPETGHDALLMFYLNAHREWVVSLYHARHRIDLDLSKIAVAHGGGGHLGACGFTVKNFPFPL